LVGLVIAQVAAAIALDQIDEPVDLLAVCSSALFFSQIGLLAFWLAFGTLDWPWRIGSFLAGTAALVWSDWTNEETAFDNLLRILLIGLSELVVATGLVVARYGPMRLRLIQLGEPVFSSARFQFSLRQMMTLVVVVAVLLTAAKPIRAYVSTVNITIEEPEFVDDGVTLEIIGILAEGTLFLGGVVISWVATWACVGIAGLWARSLLAVVFALALGSLLAYCFNPLFPEQWYYLPTLLVGQSIITMASLLVVRSCGFRLIGRNEMAT
jgi:hypothetical protein